MKFKGLDGQEYAVTLVDKQRGAVSSYHERARHLLTKLYPFDKFFEEVTLPGSKTEKNKVLYADFYCHSKKLMIEVQGEQHGKFNSFFYSSKLDFLKAQARDKNKKQWCTVNGITLVELPYNESDEQWTKRLNGSAEIS